MRLVDGRCLNPVGPDGFARLAGAGARPGCGPRVETLSVRSRAARAGTITERMNDPCQWRRAELVAWRNQLGWSLYEAARQLGISRRAYVYLEAGLTSRVPRVTELACAELGRRHGSPIRRAG